jgi:hypothetical protein
MTLIYLPYGLCDPNKLHGQVSKQVFSREKNWKPPLAEAILCWIPVPACARTGTARE